MQLELESFCAVCAHIARAPELRLLSCVSLDLPKFSPQRRASPPWPASATEVYRQPHLP